MRVYVILLIFIAIITFLHAALLGSPSSALSCIPRSASQNPLVMERVCSHFLDADCVCDYVSEGNIECTADFNSKLHLECDENACTTTFLGRSDLAKPELINPQLTELLCEKSADADCACEKTDESNIYCSINNANIEAACDEDGCDVSSGVYTQHLNYCPSERAFSSSTSLNNIDVRIEGQVERTEDSRKILKDGVISISGELENGIGVEVMADLGSVRSGSNVRAAKSKIKEELRSKFAKAIKQKYSTDKFKTLDAIQINLDNLVDGDEITFAKVRFKVPKSLVDGDVVVLRYGDDGEVSVLTPTMVDKGSYYLYEVETGGLSLYAVATVQQISEPLSESNENAPSPLCGTAGAILFILASLYTYYAVKANM